MSNYRDYAQHPYTKKIEMATWLDDFYGHHRYGVAFDDGLVVPEGMAALPIGWVRPDALQEPPHE